MIELGCITMRRKLILLVASVGMAVLENACARTQAPTVNAVQGNLEQVMLGIMYPAANVIAVAQEKDPLEIPLADDAITTPDPMGSIYGGWRAVENASIALVESTTLMTTPGRKCTNGTDVPTQNPEWAHFVEELRKDSLAAYEAAKTKDQQKLREAGTAMDMVCDSCHERYLETPNVEDRCK